MNVCDKKKTPAALKEVIDEELLEEQYGGTRVINENEYFPPQRY
jgi:hypothetical protein